MDKNQESINQIALTLAKHFDSLYYVDIESGQYVEFFRTKQFHGLDIPEQGDDFFGEFIKAAPKCVHPDDIGLVKTLYDKITMLEHLSESGSYSAIFRLIQDGKIAHVQHNEILCEDKKHIICCLENVDKAYAKSRSRKEISGLPRGWQDSMRLRVSGTRTLSASI